MTGDQEVQGTPQDEVIRREVVRRPRNGNPGTAGLGVAFNPHGRDGERFIIEQLWPNGDADPIYVREDDVLELVRALTTHYEVAEAFDD